MPDENWVYETQVYNVELRDFDSLTLGSFMLHRGPSADEFISERQQRGRDPFAEMTVRSNWPHARLKTQRQRSEDDWSVGKEFDHVIGILRLWKPGGVGRSVGLSASPLEYAGGVSLSLPRPHFRDGTWLCERDEIQGVTDFFKSLYPIRHDDFRIAWKRFNSYFSRLDDQDAFIDLLVTLEAAFGDRRPGETSYKTALRAALFLEETTVDRANTYRILKKAYDERSSVLHGRTSKVDWVTENIGHVEERVRRSIVKLALLAKEGSVPQGDEWNSFLFWPNP